LLEISSYTVGDYVNVLYRKLNIASRAEALSALMVELRLSSRRRPSQV